MFGDDGSGEDDHANPQVDWVSPWTGPARSGLSLPNTGEACATGETSTNLPCKASMSRCKQELMSEDDDTDRVLISSPLTARYRHMATRAVVVVVGVDGKGRIQSRRFHQSAPPLSGLGHSHSLPVRFDIPPTTDEMKNNRTFLGRHRPMALSWDHGIERPLPTVTSPGSTGRGRRRARWPSRPGDFAMCVPALDSQHRQARVVAGRPPRWLHSTRPHFWLLGCDDGGLGDADMGQDKMGSRRRVRRECSSREHSHRDMTSPSTSGTEKLSRWIPSSLPNTHRGHRQQFARTLAWQSLKAR